MKALGLQKPQMILALLGIFFPTFGFSANNLGFETLIDLDSHRGQTFLSVMRAEVKPALDKFAKQGFLILPESQVLKNLDLVEKSVAAGAIRAAGGIESLKRICRQLNSSEERINFYELPERLGKLGVGSGRYELSTFLALASGGGVALQINSENTAYNVNYGSGDKAKDEMTGRSFGESLSRKALDPSDKYYLQKLADYVTNDSDNIRNFYESLLEILLNSDTRRFGQVSKPGQLVATDFLAIYTAEQDRHLMANLRSHPWDEALLEVTLLSAFHSGQDKFMMMYRGSFTDTTERQSPGCNTQSRPKKRASMSDYWQFSRSTDPENCNRSGINVTRSDFRNLGALITRYQKKNHPELVQRIERQFYSNEGRGNLYAQLSNFLISFKTDSQLKPTTLELAKDFTDFLLQTKLDANKINEFIIQEWNPREDQ